MFQAVLSICINIIATTIILAVNHDLGTGYLLFVGGIAGAANLLSIAGLLIYSQSRSKAAAISAIVGFALLSPLGLIGAFGVKGMLNSGEQPEKASTPEPKKRLQIFLLTGFILLFLIIISGSATGYFLRIRNIINLLKTLPIYILLSFGVLITLRQNYLDLSMPALATLSALLISKALSYHPAGAVIFIMLSLLVLLIISLVHTLLIRYTGISSVLITFISSYMTLGVLRLIANGEAEPADSLQILYAPVFSLAIPLTGAALVYLQKLAENRLTLSASTKPFKHLLAGWTVFLGSAVLAMTAGLYTAGRVGSTVPFMNVFNVIVLGYFFFSLRILPEKAMNKLGVLLALLPATAAGALFNRVSLAGLNSDIQMLILTGITLITGLISYTLVPGRKMDI